MGQQRRRSNVTPLGVESLEGKVLLSAGAGSGMGKSPGLIADSRQPGQPDSTDDSGLSDQFRLLQEGLQDRLLGREPVGKERAHEGMKGRLQDRERVEIELIYEGMKNRPTYPESVGEGTKWLK